jgi:tetratricopeptide (TPR) repeat protein
VSVASTRALLETYAGHWRAAGEAALQPLSYTFGAPERWCVVTALRDYALRAGDLQRAEALIAARYALPPDAAWDVGVFNFREAQVLAHVQLALGRRQLAQQHLGQVIAWIDANPRYGPLYNLRTKAQALMLLGRTDAALATLAESFDKLDYTHWRYTLELDPTWASVRRDPRFVAIGAAVRAHVEPEKAALARLRAEGVVPMRGRPP